MKDFKFLQTNDNPINHFDFGGLNIPTWIIEPGLRDIYGFGYMYADNNRPRENDFRDGLSDRAKDIFDAGWFSWFTQRMIT